MSQIKNQRVIGVKMGFGAQGDCLFMEMGVIVFGMTRDADPQD